MASKAPRFIARATPKNIKPKTLQWFPGHMAKGLKRMQMMSSKIDCVIEVHDARIPFTSRNTYANKAYEKKPRILLLNKCDLVSQDEVNVACRRIAVQEGIRVVPTHLMVKNMGLMRSVIRSAHEMASAEQLTTTKESYNLFVSGVPNVGKSTFINLFTKKQDTDKNKLKIAPHPGVTKNLSNKVKIMKTPLTYIYDTPGVNLPRPEDFDSAMKLAVVGGIPEHVTGVVETADYALFWLNRKKEYAYAKQCGLSGPSNNIIEVLAYMSRLYAFETASGKPDILRTGEKFLKQFRKGGFGYIMLEDLI